MPLVIALVPLKCSIIGYTLYLRRKCLGALALSNMKHTGLEWIPVRADLVLVFDLALCATYWAATQVAEMVKRIKINGSVTRGNNVGAPSSLLNDRFEHYIRHHYDIIINKL